MIEPSAAVVVAAPMTTVSPTEVAAKKRLKVYLNYSSKRRHFSVISFRSTDGLKVFPLPTEGRTLVASGGKVIGRLIVVEASFSVAKTSRELICTSMNGWAL